MSPPADSILWTDSHCHIQSEPGLDAILDRCRTTGTQRLIMIGTDEESSRAAVTVAGERSGDGDPPVDLWATIGLHPHEAKTGVEGVRSYLSELGPNGLSRQRVVAIGECGLDFHYDYSPRDAQRAAFSAQVALAHQYRLALVVHTREAWEETFSLLDVEGVPDRLVFHCFTGGREEAMACLGRGGFLSFSGIATFSTATDIREAISVCPTDRMLVETDSPYLTPVPHRGKPNQPSFVALVGAQVAAVKEMTEAEVAQATTANAAVVFDLHG